MRPFLICLLAAATSVASGAVTKPNIVLIVADDLGWRDLGCYGSDLHETPHIDRLAAAGVRFTDAYAAAPVCTPTRASILTGEHPARLNMTIWREASRDRGTRQLLEPLTLSDLPLGETTLAEVLHDHGYYTAHIGKWHLGGAALIPSHTASTSTSVGPCGELRSHSFIRFGATSTFATGGMCQVLNQANQATI